MKIIEDNLLLNSRSLMSVPISNTQMLIDLPQYSSMGMVARHRRAHLAAIFDDSLAVTDLYQRETGHLIGYAP